jgi:penicillin-binding protein 2
MAGDRRGTRLGVLGVVTLTLLATLFGRLWYLTSMAPEQGAEEVIERTRERRILLPPMRGRILDRAGRVLAENKRLLTVTVDRAQIRDGGYRTALFGRIAGVLGTTPEELETRYASDKYDPYLPLPLSDNVAETMAAYLKERREDYPGVAVDETWQRVYRYAPLASHVIGYMGAIPADELDGFLDEGYRYADRVGTAGIEKQYEAQLRGVSGEIVYEVDAQNRIVREVSRRDPIPGNDVVLSLDLRLQQHAEQVLQAGLREARTKRPPPAENGQLYPYYQAPAGAVVVEDPRSGEILAMASYPTFDNRYFAEGITNAKIDQLYPEKEESAPFVNRAVSSPYQLGSTFKLVTAMAGLKMRDITPTSVFVDRGTYTIPDCDPNQGFRCTFRNAGIVRERNRPVSLTTALTISVDTYFYSIGVNLHNRGKTEAALNGQEEQIYYLQDVAREFGFGIDSGIDLPFEYNGTLPDAALKEELAERGAIRASEGDGYYVGDNLQFAIGQGLLTATPLQLTNAYATFANGGVRYQPMAAIGTLAAGSPMLGAAQVDMTRVRWIERRAPIEEERVEMQPDWWAAINAGFIGAVNSANPTGTAFQTFKTYQMRDVLPVAGKTGTAQEGNNDPELDDSLFVGYGPMAVAQPVRYVIGAVIQDGGYGSGAAAPVAKCLFEALGDPSRMSEVHPADPLDRTAAEPTSIPPLRDTSCLATPVGELVRD